MLYRSQLSYNTVHVPVITERTQKLRKNGRVVLNYLHMHQGSPLLTLFREVSCSLHRHPSDARHLLRNPSNLTSVFPHSPSTYFRHQHPSSHTILINFLQVSKPSQCALIHTNHQLLLYFGSATHLFIPNSIHTFVALPPNFASISCQEHSFSQHILLIHNATVIQSLLRIYSQSSIVQHTFQLSPRIIPINQSVSHTLHPRYLKQ